MEIVSEEAYTIEEVMKVTQTMETPHLALQDEPPHELVNRAQYALSQYGCWLNGGQQNMPDTCVLDTGTPQDCWHAERLVGGGKDKCNCPYWNTCHPI